MSVNQKSSLKILITSPSLEITENVSGISSVVNTIIKNNSQVTYIHLLSGKKDNEGNTLKRFTNVFDSYRILYKHIQTNNFDILHLNLPLNTKSILREFVVFLLCYFKKKPILTHLHGGRYLIEKAPYILNKIIKFILKNSKIVLALSELEKETVKKEYNINSVKVLKNTINFPENINRPTINNKVVNILFLGRLHESKGLEVIINAIKILNINGYNTKFKLNICGKGPLEEFIFSEEKEIENIKFHGIVGGKAKIEILSTCDIFLLPSLHGEGLPVALLEAMAYGLVPIVTTDGSMGYLIENGKNGLIVEKSNPIDLAEKIKTLIFNENFCLLLSNNARDYVKNNFDITNYINNLNIFYKIAKPT
ncbi:glycosyltransferase family 4 protein [Adhaeribacter aquaticus]|uniref:glycosyltransferase family 4 protein n=1 Tax=Adhaeribacter aquaticus TaxID=299567 RepID=UPI0004219788|nr:glycosyltransferase family 4 protein [Adhaeribacter aquaticus]